MKALSLRCVTQNGKKPVADPAQLFLDQTEAQRAKKKFLDLLSQGLHPALKMSLQ